jgi:PmbA protein
MVRVRESGRTGLHRSGLAMPADLDKAVREALAQARLAAPSPSWTPSSEAPAEIPGLADPEIPRMTAARAREVIQKTAEDGEVARVGWAEGRFAVVNSRGMRRATEATAAWLEVVCGDLPGAGRAAAVARSLAGLDGPAVFARARRWSAPAGEPAGLPAGPLPVVLAPGAVATLLHLLNHHALSSLSFLDGTSFLRERTGQEVFHPALSLRDDPLAAGGAPFPFDLRGAAKRPLDLVADGVFLGPVRDERLAHALGLAPTAHLVAPDEARAAHLTLVPGDLAEEALLAQAGGGVWMGGLDPIEAFDPRALRFRAVVRGARLISGGALGAALPDLVWEDSLPALLGRVLAVGAGAVALPAGDPLLGAVTAPPLALAGVAGLRPAPTPRS